ncbi:MAG: hypothetical protein MJE77_11635 [Proteobacteria bacterium]|nr:hypothetical protein [Pseudomonadota bacterium]
MRRSSLLASFLASKKATAVLCGVLLAASGFLAACTSFSGSGSGTSRSRTGPEKAAPMVVQLHSPPLYRSFVSRSVPYQAIAETTRRAAVISRLRVRELDTVFDDKYERHGTIVILGIEDNAVVGFTTRYSVDITYPDNDLIRDGMGLPEFHNRDLIITPGKNRCARRGRRWCSLQYALVKAPPGRLRFPSQATAYYRTFGDNDAVLIYFPRRLADRLAEASLRPMGMDSPTVAVARTLSDATEILGKEFVLVSPKSLQLLRKHAHADSVVATYAPEVFSWAAGLFGAVKFVQKLIGRGMEHFTMDRNKLQAALTYRLGAAYAAQMLIAGFDFHGSVVPDGRGRIHLPPLHLAEVSPRHSERAVAFMQQIVGSARVEMVLFGPNSGSARRGMLFVPARHVNLNYELVRSGLARLAVDAASREALGLFPEFVDAARDALADGVGFAAEWRGDAEYVQAVERAGIASR